MFSQLSSNYYGSFALCAIYESSDKKRLLRSKVTRVVTVGTLRYRQKKIFFALLNFSCKWAASNFISSISCTLDLFSVWAYRMGRLPHRFHNRIHQLISHIQAGVLEKIEKTTSYFDLCLRSVLLFKPIKLHQGQYDSLLQSLTSRLGWAPFHDSI